MHALVMASWIVPALALLFGWIVGCGSALAQDKVPNLGWLIDDAERLLNKKNLEECRHSTDVFTVIQACTKVLRSKMDKKTELEVFLSIGRAYNMDGELDADSYEKAIINFSNAIALDPKNVEAYRGRGKAYGARNKHDKGIEDLNQVIALEPEKSWAYEERGVIYFGNQDYDRAILDFNEAIKRNPKEAVYYIQRGLAYENKGELAKSADDYDQAYRIDPKPRYGNSESLRMLKYLESSGRSRSGVFGEGSPLPCACLP
jgi:tetratricopeptide (TPR) repeat protein